MNVSLVNSPDSTTMSKCTYLLVVLLFLACGGKTSLVDDIRVMQSTPIDLCLDSLQYYIPESDNQADIDSVSFYQRKTSLVVYTDSSACSSCTLKSMYHWLGFLDEIRKRYGEGMAVYFIFSPKKTQMYDFNNALQTLYLEYPVFIDTANVFLRHNAHIPSNKSCHIFLIDQDGWVKLVGSPQHNLKMKELLFEISDELIKNQNERR